MSRPSRSLKTYWYDQLKEDGFEDIEDENEALKCWHTSYFQCRYSPQSFVEKQQYYQMTKTFLRTHKFKSKQHKQIWFLHSEGFSIREIAKQLSLNKDSVINPTLTQLIWIMRFGS